MDTTYLEEKNAIASNGAWIWLIEITLSGADPIRYANSNEDVPWGIYEWHRATFAVDDVNASIKGEFPELTLHIGDVDPHSDLREQVKETGGLIGGTLRLLVVHSAHLSLTTAAIDESAEIIGCDLDNKSVNFTLGVTNFLSKRFPQGRYVPGFCRHRFKDALCKYDGTDTKCDHTLTQCIEKSNSQNYGGSPGMIG